MPGFRLFFRDTGAIVGLEDFEASDADAARSIADALYDACSDRCSGYELWAGTTLLVNYVEPAARPPTAALHERHQALVVEIEEAIQRTNWTVAGSKRLLQQLEAMKNPARDANRAAKPLDG